MGTAYHVVVAPHAIILRRSCLLALARRVAVFLVAAHVGVVVRNLEVEVEALAPLFAIPVQAVGRVALR